MSATLADNELLISRTFHAPAALVFAMWTDPANEESWFGGVYREIVPHSRLVFTFQWDRGPSAQVETLVTIILRERAGKTDMTFHQAPFLDKARRDSHEKGWSSALDKSVAYADQIAQQGTFP